MFDAWYVTVFGRMRSAVAMSLFVLPDASRRSTSNSRVVRPLAVPDAVGAPSSEAASFAMARAERVAGLQGLAPPEQLSARGEPVEAFASEPGFGERHRGVVRRDRTQCQAGADLVLLIVQGAVQTHRVVVATRLDACEHQ